MAKKTVTAVAAEPVAPKKQQELAQGEWGDKVPEAVQEAVDSYVEAKRALGTARGNTNTARDVVIQKMLEHKVPRVRIDEGNKVLELDTTQAVKIRKAQKVEPESDEGGDDEE